MLVQPRGGRAGSSRGQISLNLRLGRPASSLIALGLPFAPLSVSLATALDGLDGARKQPLRLFEGLPKPLERRRCHRGGHLGVQPRVISRSDCSLRGGDDFFASVLLINARLQVCLRRRPLTRHAREPLDRSLKHRLGTRPFKR